jgi:hypothetical protein
MGQAGPRLRLAHNLWHVNGSYINISGRFYYLTSVLDGYGRFILR